jgi:hypothetical protein
VKWKEKGGVQKPAYRGKAVPWDLGKVKWASGGEIVDIPPRELRGRGRGAVWDGAAHGVVVRPHPQSPSRKAGEGSTARAGGPAFAGQASGADGNDTLLNIANVCGSAFDATPGTFNRSSGPLSHPTAAVAPPGARANYHPGYGRSGSLVGQDPWDLLPPDDTISAGDIAAVVAQFGPTACKDVDRSFRQDLRREAPGGERGTSVTPEAGLSRGPPPYSNHAAATRNAAPPRQGRAPRCGWATTS